MKVIVSFRNRYVRNVLILLNNLIFSSVLLRYFIYLTIIIVIKPSHYLYITAVFEQLNWEHLSTEKPVKSSNLLTLLQNLFHLEMI